MKDIGCENVGLMVIMVRRNGPSCYFDIGSSFCQATAAARAVKVIQKITELCLGREGSW